ncbi:MAG: hypothetical protein ACYC8T_06550 [Myxococcaceae bacterium]
MNPLVAQVGTIRSEHFASSLGVLWSPREGIAVGLTGRYYWVSRPSPDINTLPMHWDVLPDTVLLSTWAALASSELTPIRGEFMALGAGPLELALSLNGGLGVIGTRHQLKAPSDQTGPATYGDTGVHFAGAIGAGLTATLWRGLALHLAFDVLLYSNRSSTVNGCNGTDLDLMDRTQRGGGSLEGIAVSSGCNLASFSGTDSATGLHRGNDVPLARNLVISPSAEWVKQTTLSLGASWAF